MGHLKVNDAVLVREMGASVESETDTTHLHHEPEGLQALSLPRAGLSCPT